MIVLCRDTRPNYRNEFTVQIQLRYVLCYDCHLVSLAGTKIWHFLLKCFFLIFADFVCLKQVASKRTTFHLLFVSKLMGNCVLYQYVSDLYCSVYI